MKSRCAAVVCMIAVCCFGGTVRVFGQDDGSDMSMADVKASIDVERGAISELRQRQETVEREKSLLEAEIESEAFRISKLNRTIERQPRRVHTSSTPKKQASKPAPKSATRPAVRRTKEAVPVEASPPKEAAPAIAPIVRTPPAETEQTQKVSSSPAFDARIVDAESQAEIDRLSTMKKDLISERNTLEHVVQQRP